MQPMLRTIDIFIGVALVMLLVSMLVTVITQAVTSLLNSRGKHLMRGVADMLEQLHPGITRGAAETIATAVLSQPLVSAANGKVGSVIHREELTKILLELAAGEAPKQLDATAQEALRTALVRTGVCKDGTPDEIRAQVSEKLKNIRTLALQLELMRPDLTNAARAKVAILEQASSEFLAKINLSFDQTMDRVSERFTTHARQVTFAAGLAVALVLQLDTAALVSRLSSDDALRQSLVDLAQKQQSAPGSQATPIQLTDVDKQNLKDLMVNNVIGIPQSASDWAGRWTLDNCVVKTLGILLTALLLSLGAPFWYGTLQSLLRLRSALAVKDDQQREQRQVSGQPPPEGAAGPVVEGVVLSDERGNLAVA